MPKNANDDTTTLYQQVQMAISNMIEMHRLHPGAPLPSEKELESLYGVSRITIRRALEELERDGQVVRSKGRSARVAHPIQAHARTRLADDFMTMLDIVRGTVPELLQFEWQMPDDDLYAQLELKSREPVLRVERLRKTNGRPTLHTVAHVPASIGVKLKREEVDKTTMIEILAKTGVIPVHVEQFMSAVACDPQIAKHLAVADGAPIFQIDRLVRDDTGQIIQKVRISFRGENFTYHLSANLSDGSNDVEMASTAMLNHCDRRSTVQSKTMSGRDSKISR